MKILCFSSSDRQKEYSQFHDSLKMYCATRNIPYTMFSIPTDFSRRPSWSKVHILLNTLLCKPEYDDIDFFWWVDDDIILTNPEKDIYDVCANISLDKCIAIQKDTQDIPRHTFNCGTMLIRNCTASLTILQETWVSATPQHIVEPNWEQDAMIELYLSNNNTHVHSKIQLLEWKTLQSFYRIGHPTPKGLEWCEGDFIAHLTGMTTVDRFALFEKLKVRCEHNI
jgi:hypothetical protein